MRQEVLTVPDSNVLEALRGDVSELKYTVSQKPANKGQEVAVKIVTDGSGMVGLVDSVDNREWAGIFNHFVKTARIATYLGRELQDNGVEVDTILLLNAILISHAGRRQWDEATRYPDLVAHPHDFLDLEVVDSVELDQTHTDTPSSVFG
jgi:hypothetical protein